MSIEHKKSYWPYAIVAVFILFGAFIGYMVRQTMRTDVDLVSKDYYAKEIAYQQHIDNLGRTSAAGGIQLTYAEAAGSLAIRFPESLKGQKVSGTIQFFRPSDAKMDFELPLLLDGQLQQIVRVDELQKGYWRIKISSTASGQEYFAETNLTVK